MKSSAVCHDAFRPADYPANVPLPPDFTNQISILLSCRMQGLSYRAGNMRTARDEFITQHTNDNRRTRFERVVALKRFVDISCRLTVVVFTVKEFMNDVQEAPFYASAQIPSTEPWHTAGRAAEGVC